jgi:hypothetical protein
MIFFSIGKLFLTYFKAINCYEKRMRKLTVENAKLTSPGSSKTVIKKEAEKTGDHVMESNGECCVVNVDDEEEQEEVAVDMMDTDEAAVVQLPLSITKETRTKIRINRIKMAKYRLALGHFYLLIYDYVSSLNSYRQFLALKVNKLKVRSHK